VAWMRWAEVFVWLYNYPTAFPHQRFLLALTYCRRPFTSAFASLCCVRRVRHVYRVCRLYDVTCASCCCVWTARVGRV
jgi:hypothetical protein